MKSNSYVLKTSSPSITVPKTYTEATIRGRALAAHSGRWGALPVVSLIASLGFFVVALADTAARIGAAWSYALFWVGVLVLFMPIALRLALRHVTRTERIGSIVLLGLGMYLIKVMHSPVAFTFNDEF